MGLFQQAKFRPVAGMIINLVVSVLLVNKWGICGILVGTIVADWSTLMWFDPIVIHKYGFKNVFPVRTYFIKFILNFSIVILVGAVDLILCRFILVGFGWVSVVIHAGICGLTIPIALMLVNMRRAEGRYTLSK
jgi:hypothetical protein